jgi:hypothetical protein
MKKYKISISGHGADCYIYRLNEEQNEALTEGCVDEGDMSMDEILDVLEKEYITDTDELVQGVYTDPESYKITVTDDSGQLVWESDDETDLTPQIGDSEITYDEPQTLICEDILKGEFFNYELELEEDFNPEKLTPILQHVGDMVTIMTGFRYDGKKMEVSEFGDYWDKGYNFFLI